MEEEAEENENEEGGNTEEDLNYYDYENSNNLNNYSFLKFLKFDLKRKIKASDISWESEEFDINDPKFSSDEDKLNEEREDEEQEEFEVSEVSEDIDVAEFIDNCDINFKKNEKEYDIYQDNKFDVNVKCKEEKNLISTFENLNLNNFNYLKSENDSYNRSKNAKELYNNLNTHNANNKDTHSKIAFNEYNSNNNNEKINSPAYATKRNVDKILAKKQPQNKNNNLKINNENNKEKKQKQKVKKEKIDFSEILAEINRLKLSSDNSQNNLNLNKFSKKDKMIMNEELNFSNNCFPYRTMVYSSEILSSENISLMQNVSEINNENNFSGNNKRQDLDIMDNSDRNINLNDYSFSRVNSVNHSYNISSFMKKASNQTIETINRNSKNGFHSKVYFLINYKGLEKEK